eukprot:gene5228-5885_t
MPIRDNWIESPLDLISDAIEYSGCISFSTVRECFEERLKSLQNIDEIPCLNDLATEKIRPNSLVRCRCMVQDQFDPEYFLGLYETLDKSSGVRRTRAGIYRDTSDCGKDEVIIHESSKNVTLERQSLYCVPVPAENEWQPQEYSSHRSSGIVGGALTDASKGFKRQRDDEMEDIRETAEFTNDVQKRQRAANGNASNGAGSSHVTFKKNFPLESDTGKPCMVIMYDNDDTVKLNEVVEFIGVLSCDTSLAAATMESPDSHSDELVTPGMMSAEELSAHCPPSSLVPRLHCILTRRLSHDNPLIPSSLVNEDDGRNFLRDNSLVIRQNIIESLAKLLYGDTVAAEFVLLNLVSRVYGRADVIALGKFALNLTKCPSTAEPTSTSLPVEVGKFFELVTTKSHYIPLTITNLNSKKFVPKKDYNANRLLSGTLQLSEGTHLVLDETVMEPGQLDTNGVQNVTAIGNVVQWQKVEYDFSFHKCDMPTDLTVLVLSEGRSLIQCDCLLPLKKQQTSLQNADAIISAMDASMLRDIRVFLDVVRFMKFNMSDEMQEAVKEDYVRMREADSNSINADTFHLLLIMARLVALSYGQNILTPELWDKTKELETERRQRLV